MARRLWLVWSTFAGLAMGAYFLVPADRWFSNVFYDTIGLLSVAALLVGVRRNRPTRPRLWYLFALGLAIWVLGDMTFGFYQYVLHEAPYPSFADVLYLSAYPVLVGGLLTLIRGQGRDPSGVIDASIGATGLGLMFWAFVMSPVARDSSSPLLQRTISLAYPAVDVLLLIMIVRLFTGAAIRTASFRLLLTAVAFMFVSDVAYSVVTSYDSSYDGHLLDVGWLLSYVLWAASALHPSMRLMTDTPVRPQGGLSRRRLVLLAISSLLAPALLLLEGFTEPAAKMDWFAIGISAVALFLLVVVRMSGLVSQVQVQANQLSNLAMRDDLTGLPNRRLFEEMIRDAMADGGRPEVALIDLDDFKTINDGLGHAVGDQLLAAVGRRLGEVQGSRGGVARLGGDEFGILMPDDRGAADELVAQIAAALEQPVFAGEHHLLVRASIGVADAAGTTDPFELLRRADVAMYAAKETGGRQVRFSPELDRRAAAHAQLGAQLREAIDRGQFQLVYQPIVTLPDGHIAGVEALIRWHHPTLGFMSPVDFIPVAERNGQIVELGAWILLEACSQAATWLAELGAAAPRKVSVNVSARQLAEVDFPEVVAAVLAATGLPAEILTIEVTETAVFGGGRAIDALHAVHRLGVQIALDDFGTGHSSLGLLQTCPVDILKVDKSFVDNITKAGRHAVIATALINVSDGLNLIAIAEGVETVEQAQVLYSLGYRYAQGYHFGRPVAEPDFALAEAAA